MDLLKEILASLEFLKIFKNDWAKLVALLLILVTFLLLNCFLTHESLLISCVFIIVIVYIPSRFDYLKHAKTEDSGVKKAKFAYSEEERNHRSDDDTLL